MLPKKELKILLKFFYKIENGTNCYKDEMDELYHIWHFNHSNLKLNSLYIFSAY